MLASRFAIADESVISRISFRIWGASSSSVRSPATNNRGARLQEGQCGLESNAACAADYENGFFAKAKHSWESLSQPS